MALSQTQCFVLDYCLKQLHQELLQSSPKAVSLHCDFKHRLRNCMELEDLEEMWERRLREDQGLAEMVAAGISAVLGRVKVEPDVVAAMERLRLVAVKAGSNLGRECEDSVQSDTGTIQSRSLLCDSPGPLAHIHLSFQVNFGSTPSPSIANTTPTCPVPRHSETPLSLLYCAAGPRRHPKLENFRLKLIRGMMRSIREFAKGKVLYPKSGSHAIDICNPEQVQWYERLRAQFDANRADLEPCGRTQNGPETNKLRQKGKSQRKSTRPASYNDSFCAELLAVESVTDYFQTYLSVVFSDTNLQSLCKRLKVKCCGKAKHTQQCTEVWRQVQDFARWGMLERLGLDPSQRYLGVVHI